MTDTTETGKRFTEPVALSSTAPTNLPPSTLRPPRTSPWRRSRPSRAPCSVQGPRYDRPAGSSRGDRAAVSAKCAKNIDALSGPALRIVAPMGYGPIVDTDIHQELRDPEGDLYPYL